MSRLLRECDVEAEVVESSQREVVESSHEVLVWEKVGGWCGDDFEIEELEKKRSD